MTSLAKPRPVAVAWLHHLHMVVGLIRRDRADLPCSSAMVRCTNLMRSLVLALALVCGGLLALPGTAMAQGVDAIANPGPGRIQAIQVNGNLRVDEATVLSYMELGVGDPFDPNRLNDTVKALFETGLFSNVQMQRAGGTLIVVVQENAVVNRVAFEGNRAIEDDILQAEVNIEPRRVFTATRVQADVERILEIYRRSGRFGAQVEPKIIQLDQNRVDVVFEIFEGDKTKVTQINFIGNQAFTDRRLRGTIRTSEARFYRILAQDDTYDPDRLQLDQELLRVFYRRNGYADFRVLSAVAELSPDGKDFFITFSVEEGPRYDVGTITLLSEVEGVDPESVRDLLEIDEGDEYDSVRIEDSESAIVDSLNKQGIPFVQVDTTLARRSGDAAADNEAEEGERFMDLTMTIKPAPRVFVERIDIDGNVRTLDRVIRREMLLVEGDPYNAANLRRSERRINNLGFFRRVNVETVQGSAPDQQVVQVEVEEQSTGEIQIGAGYSNSSGVAGDFSITERNFLGRGQTVSLSALLSFRRSEVDFSFTEPYFLQRDLAATVNAFHRTVDFNDESGFDSRDTGAGVTFSYPLGEYLRQSVGYRIQQTRLTNIDTNGSQSVLLADRDTLLSQVSQTLTYDTRDSRIQPGQGHLVRLSNDLAGLGGDRRFLRTVVEGEIYTTLSEGVVASMVGRVGHIQGLGRDVDINDRFFAGADSFPGFAARGIGPRDTNTNDSVGGNTLAIGRAEVAYELDNILPGELGLRAHGFGVAGTVCGVDENYAGLEDGCALRASVGVGISWRSPFGPIRVNASWAGLHEDFDETEIFGFSFGSRF